MSGGGSRRPGPGQGSGRGAGVSGAGGGLVAGDMFTPGSVECVVFLGLGEFFFP